MPSSRRSNSGRRDFPPAVQQSEAKLDPEPSAPHTGKINGSIHPIKATYFSNSVNSSYLGDIKLVNATLSEISGYEGTWRFGRNERGLPFWISVIVMEVLLFVWLRWTAEVYTEIRPKLGKFFK
ncbi:unnamed protein product [Phytomonas sp. Hart1]|nr:unnamed protein product [Phytomonas sp. Hart1]|eukprot:CCW67459.1 unnamed protein product [Phytomonas sp. isolate Hart1]